MSTFDLKLRSADQAGDQHFIFRCYEAGMRQHIEWAWGWDATTQREGFWRNLPLSGFLIIERNECPAGMLFVEVTNDAHVLRMIVLDPRFQNLGLGSHLIQAEINRAHGSGKVLLLTVIKSNRAKALYERLGMSVVGEAPRTLSMRSSGPLAAAAPTVAAGAHPACKSRPVTPGDTPCA